MKFRLIPSEIHRAQFKLLVVSFGIRNIFEFIWSLLCCVLCNDLFVSINVDFVLLARANMLVLTLSTIK